MKKSILNLGKILNKAQQKEVFGGWNGEPMDLDCQTKAQCEGPYNTGCGSGKCVPMDGTTCFVCDHRYAL